MRLAIARGAFARVAQENLRGGVLLSVRRSSEATKRPSTLTAGVSSATAIAACDACAAAGQKVAFAEIVNVFALLGPPPPFAVGLFGSTAGPVNTATEAQLSVVNRFAGTVAVNCDAEPKVVARFVVEVVVFQTTIDPFRGVLPWRCSARNSSR